MSRRAKLERLLQTNPNDAFLTFALAMELAKEGQFDQAVTQFDRVLALDAAYIPAHFQKGNTLLAAGRPHDARTALQAGISTAARSGDAHAAAEMQAVLDSIA